MGDRKLLYVFTEIIDCGKVYCGQCYFNTGKYCEFFRVDDLEGGKNPKRCDDCLSAEMAYKDIMNNKSVEIGFDPERDI